MKPTDKTFVDPLEKYKFFLKIETPEEVEQYSFSGKTLEELLNEIKQNKKLFVNTNRFEKAQITIPINHSLSKL